MKEIIYIGDPMCSWCWGFAPAVDAMREEYAGRAEVSLVVGGLRVGPSPPVNEEMKEYLLHHWREVNEASGQPFNLDCELPEDFVYDTEPSCRAVVTVRLSNPERAFEFFKDLQRAFYVENKDVTSETVLAQEAAQFGYDEKNFLAAFNAVETRRKTMDDIAFAAQLGITGFPSVVLRDGEHYTLLTYGYTPFSELKPHLDAWVDGASEQSASNE